MIFGKNDIYDLLNAKNIPFTCTEHRPVYSMEEFDVLDIPANAVICKNLFLRFQRPALSEDPRQDRAQRSDQEADDADDHIERNFLLEEKKREDRRQDGL